MRAISFLCAVLISSLAAHAEVCGVAATMPAGTVQVETEAGPGSDVIGRARGLASKGQPGAARDLLLPALQAPARIAASQQPLAWSLVSLAAAAEGDPSAARLAA